MLQPGDNILGWSVRTVLPWSQSGLLMTSRGSLSLCFCLIHFLAPLQELYRHHSITLWISSQFLFLQAHINNLRWTEQMRDIAQYSTFSRLMFGSSRWNIDHKWCLDGKLTFSQMTSANQSLRTRRPCWSGILLHCTVRWAALSANLLAFLSCS